MEKENENLTSVIKEINLSHKEGKEMGHINPAKPGKQPIVNKNMTIGEQLKAQEKKKGKKHFIINSEESVDWFIKTLIAPENSKKNNI